MLPPIPSWDAVHPLVVHFPIALLAMAPVLVALGLVVRDHRRGLFLGALAVMTAGTAGSFLAVATGLAAADRAAVLPGVSDAIERHEELGETARNLYTGLTLLYAFLLFAPETVARRLRRFPEGMLQGVFLVLYVVSLPVLANTAHRGGILVHGYGIHADVGVPEPTPGEARPATPSPGDESGEHGAGR